MSLGMKNLNDKKKQKQKATARITEENQSSILDKNVSLLWQ